jgi:hypothetical protein
VLGPDGLSRFEELSRRETARSAILYAFDLIEHDGDDLRNLPFLDRKATLARLLRDVKAGVLLQEHIAEDGPTVFAHACRLGAEGIVSKKGYCYLRRRPSGSRRSEGLAPSRLAPSRTTSSSSNNSNGASNRAYHSNRSSPSPSGSRSHGNLLLTHDGSLRRSRHGCYQTRTR